MNSVVIPNREDLEIWTKALKGLPDLGAYLPLIDDSWFSEMRSCFEVALLHPDAKSDVCRAGAAIFHKVTKNHYRIDGNKRSAVITTYLFFLINGCRLNIAWKDLYEVARTVADSKLSVEDAVGVVHDAFKATCEVGSPRLLEPPT